MSEWVTLDVIDGVGPVAVKHRHPAEDESLLDHEARILEAIDHPGVVQLVSRRTQPDSALVTRFVGIHSLATAAPPDTDDATMIVATLAHTVEHLHAQGVRHGALDESHVLLGPGRRPILCGFSGAVGPDAAPEVAPTAADDVAALGRLVQRLVAGFDELEPIPSRRPRRSTPWRGYRYRALLTLADHCLADDPTARPSAASLAASIDDLVDQDRPSRARRAPVLVLGIAGLLAVVFAVRAFDGPDTIAIASSTSPPPPMTTTTTTTTTTVPPVACPRRGEGADVDGDGCPDAPANVAGNVVTVGDARYVLGRRGDRVLIGNWTCDGLVTAVLVRADPVGVWHFPTWASPDEPMDAVAVSGDVDPTSVRRNRDTDGCDVLLAGSPEDPTVRPLEVHT